MSFQWAPSIYYRDYEVGIVYGKYQRYCWSVPQPVFYASPMYPAGYYTNQPAGSQPAWSQCGTVAAGAWRRDSSSGYSYYSSVGTKIAGWLGINLSVTSNYSSGSSLVYTLVSNGLVCGSNTYPSQAAIVKTSR